MLSPRRKARPRREGEDVDWSPHRYTCTHMRMRVYLTAQAPTCHPLNGSITLRAHRAGASLLLSLALLQPGKGSTYYLEVLAGRLRAGRSLAQGALPIPCSCIEGGALPVPAPCSLSGIDVSFLRRVPFSIALLGRYLHPPYLRPQTSRLILLPAPTALALSIILSTTCPLPLDL